MQNYILGYNDSGTEELTQYASVAEARYTSEEWVVVEAESLEEAKEKYEESFLAWKAAQ